MFLEKRDIWHIAAEAVAQGRALEPAVINAVEELSARLESVRMLGPVFEGVDFSPELRAIAEVQCAAAMK